MSPSTSSKKHALSEKQTYKSAALDPQFGPPDEVADRDFAISEQDVKNSQEHAIEDEDSITDQNMARDRNMTN